MTRILNIIVGTLLVLVGFTATAFASAAITQPDPLIDLARPIFEAVRSGQYALAAAAALVLCVALARKYGASRFPFLGTGPGGAVLTLVGSFGGAVATAISAGAPVSLGLASASFMIALTAAGGYSLIKTLVVDPLLASKWYATKAPAWFKAALSAVSWVFVKPADAAVAEATAAGDAAVKAKPPGGAAAIVGASDEF